MLDRFVRNRLAVLAIGFAVLIGAVTWVTWYLANQADDAEALAASADAADRMKAVRKLEGKRGDSASRVLRGLAGDRDKWVGIAAVRAIRDDRVLRQILGDRKLPGPVRGEAAAALGNRKDTDPQILTQTLSADPDPLARAGAAKGLSRLCKPATIPELSKALEDPDSRVRIWAITAIHRMVVRRFPYDARKPPEQQQGVIQQIRDYLRRAKAL